MSSSTARCASRTAFESSNINLASAVAVVFFLIVLVITAVNYGLFLRRDHTTTVS